MKKQRVLLIVVVVESFLLVLAGALCFYFARNTDRPVYTKLEDDNGTLEYWYEFSDGRLYKETSILTITDLKAYSEGEDPEKVYQLRSKIINTWNKKYKGYSGKIWRKGNSCTIIQCTYIDLLSDKELKAMGMQDKATLRKLRRDDIKPIRMGNYK